MSLKESLKSSFLAGAVLVAPLVATLVILRFVSSLLAGQLQPIVRGTRLATYTANNELLAQLLALAVLLVVVTALGAVAKRSMGQRMLGKAGRIVDFVPVFRTIYGSIRQMASSMSARGSEFDSAVYVEYERDGLYRLGLKTGESPHDLADVAGEPAHNVFVPSSPNPTQGALLLVPRSRVYDSELSVRAALRVLMTTGMADASEVSGAELGPEERLSLEPAAVTATTNGDDGPEQADRGPGEDGASGEAEDSEGEDSDSEEADDAHRTGTGEQNGEAHEHSESGTSDRE